MHILETYEGAYAFRCLSFPGLGQSACFPRAQWTKHHPVEGARVPTCLTHVTAVLAWWTPAQARAAAGLPMI